MTIQTALFILFSDTLLSVLFFLILFKIKNIPLKAGLCGLVILAFGAFIELIWKFDSLLFLLIYILPSLTIAILVGIIKSKKNESEDYWFHYYTSKGELIIKNPFRGFGVFGGAGSGKTKSITKPTIENCARLNISGIIYDYKKFDLTRCAITMYDRYKSDVKLHFINFFDLKYSERVNPISADIIENPAYASQAASTLIRNLIKGSEDSKDPFFIDAGESGLAGIIWRLKEDFPTKCNLPYAVAIALNSRISDVIHFVSRNKQSSLIAAPFLQSAVSEKQLAGVAASMSSGLRKLALPQLFYVLSGNDFNLDLNNPNEPKLLCISNYQVLEDVFAPVIALTINMSLKQMNQEGKAPSIVMLDEGTTIKIPNFDNIPATARENKIITFFICQDMVQGEGAYGRIGRDKILANLANQMFGLVRNPQTAEYYSKIFGKVFEEHRSKSTKQGDLFISSSTVSERLVDKYPPQVFQNLNSGEFYGIFADANHYEFNARYKLYEEPELPMPLKSYVTQKEIEMNFNTILNDAQNLINQ